MEMLHNETLDLISLNNYKKVCSSCTIYIVLFVIFLVIRIVISGVFVYFYWYSKKDNFKVKFNPDTQTTIY